MCELTAGEGQQLSRVFRRMTLENEADW